MVLPLTVVLLLVYAVSARNVVPESNVPYGYIKNVAIPKAEQVRIEEEQLIEYGPRIVNGQPARLGEIPWQAGLLGNVVGTNSQAICGGSLISNNRVVTAAHNIRSGSTVMSSFTVVLGAITIMTGGTRIQSSRLVLHPQYIPTITHMNDIAMIYLRTSVSFSANLSPVSLPSGAEVSQNFAGFRAVASGYGVTATGAPSATLNRLDFTVLTHNQCQQTFGNIFHSTHVCASSAAGSGICVGDSGGPLVVRSSNRPVLVGVTAFGAGTCGSNSPGAFTRVTSFLSFINQHL